MVRTLEYCQSLLIGLDTRSRFALVTFSNRPRFVLNFTDQLSYRTLDSLSAAYTPAPSTDTAGALRHVCELLTSASVHQRRVGLLVVDGRYVINDARSPLQRLPCNIYGKVTDCHFLSAGKCYEGFWCRVSGIFCSLRLPVSSTLLLHSMFH